MSDPSYILHSVFDRTTVAVASDEDPDHVAGDMIDESSATYWAPGIEGIATTVFTTAAPVSATTFTILCNLHLFNGELQLEYWDGGAWQIIVPYTTGTNEGLMWFTFAEQTSDMWRLSLDIPAGGYLPGGAFDADAFDDGFSIGAATVSVARVRAVGLGKPVDLVRAPTPGKKMFKTINDHTYLTPEATFSLSGQRNTTSEMAKTSSISYTLIADTAFRPVLKDVLLETATFKLTWLQWAPIADPDDLVVGMMKGQRIGYDSVLTISITFAIVGHMRWYSA